MGLIRSVRAWMYRRSRQAQTDQMAIILYNCTNGILAAIAALADINDPSRAADSRIYLTRFADAAMKEASIARRNYEKWSGQND